MSLIEKHAIDLVAVVGATVELKRSGSRHVGLCPFHDDHLPSFFVFEDNHFKCFGCGEHGDVIDFVQKVQGCTFNEALRILGIEQGPLTHEKQKRIQQLQARRRLVKLFRNWEIEATDEIAVRLRCARKVLAQIRTEGDLLKYGELYHRLEMWQYQLDILISSDDQAKFEMFRSLSNV